jgi:uncharacterized delta-60 repeat protein
MRKLYFLFFLTIGFFANAQNQDSFSRDRNFNQFNLPLSHYFVNEDVQKSLVLSNQKILLITEKKIVRLNNNLIDNTFSTGLGFENSISDVILTDVLEQIDGKILVAGSFNKFNGINVKPIIRLNIDGSLDTTFNLTSLFQIENIGYFGLKLYLQSNGKIIFIANQTTDGGVFKNIKRLNSDGSLDNTFNPNPNLKYGRLFIQSDGKYIVSHSNIENDFYAPIKFVSRLNSDGTFDNTFSIAQFSNASDVSLTKIEATDSHVYVSGVFSGCNSISSKSFVRLLNNGTVDSSFNVGNGFSLQGSTLISFVNDFEIQADGKIVLVGFFNAYNFSYSNISNPILNNVARLNSDGSIDNNFSNNLNFLNIERTLSISFFNDERILVSGYSQTPQYEMKKGLDVFISIINNDGTKDVNFNNITKGFFRYNVNDVLEDSSGDLYACGNFHSYNGEIKSLFVKLNEDGSIDNSMNYGGMNGFIGSQNYNVKKIVLNSNNDKLFLYGNVLSYNNTNRKQIIKVNLDGSLDTSFNVSNGFNSTVKTMLPYTFDRLLVGGDFSSFNNNSCQKLVLLNANGQLWSSYDCGHNVKSLVYQNDGKILVGGAESLSSSPPFRGLRRYSSTITADATFNIDAQITSMNVEHIEITFDNKIIIIGNFVVNGINKKILRLNDSGSIDNSFNYDVANSTTTISSVDSCQDGKLIIVTFDSSTNISSLIKLLQNGSIDTSVISRNVHNDSGLVKVLNNGKLLFYGLNKDSEYDNFKINGLVKLLGEDYYYVNGINKFDFDSNGCNNDDINYSNLNFSITDGVNTNNFIANQTGSYFIPVQAGNYTFSPVLENPTYFNISPTSFTVNFPTHVSPFNQNFCVTANGVKSDVEVVLLPTTPARPGFDADYKLVYRNKGNQIEYGSISLTFDDLRLDYVSSNPVYNSSATNSFSWNYSNLQPFETREIEFTFNLNSPMEIPAVNNGDVLNYTATITSTNTDEMPIDNTLTLDQTIVGSYDPNDKTCLEGTTITPTEVGNYVHYVIRFENTGTYPAENIVVKDMIDLTKFDISTLVPLKSSHDFYTRINGDKVEFIFENINLDFNDATNDGYVLFKIKTKPTLVLGDTFTNNANIYFDYNFPITTNTYTTTVAALSTQDFDFGSYFTLYPNPAEEVLNIQTKQGLAINSIEIYNQLGQIVIATTNTINAIDVSSLASGTYFVKINSEKGSANAKFVKE